MGRLIDSQTAYDVLTDYYHHTTDTQHEALREALSRVPTVDAVPVKHGRWIKMGHIEHTWLVSKCSVCGNQTIDAGTYCPNCGARMDGKDGEKNG